MLTLSYINTALSQSAFRIYKCYIIMFVIMDYFNISGEAGHLSFPIPRGLQCTSRNWTKEIYPPSSPFLDAICETYIDTLCIVGVSNTPTFSVLNVV
jgi:hypothetical protein